MLRTGGLWDPGKGVHPGWPQSQPGRCGCCDSLCIYARTGSRVVLKEDILDSVGPEHDANDMA